MGSNLAAIEQMTKAIDEKIEQEKVMWKGDESGLGCGELGGDVRLIG